MSRVRILTFLVKKGQNVGGRHSRDADILACFGQVVPVQPAVPVRRTRRPYKLSGFVSRFHLGTARRRGNTFRERSSAGLRRRAEWRVCRAQIVRDWTPTSILGRRHFSFCLLFYLFYFQGANIFIDADILGRQHFRAPTFS